jgi:adenine-specific DNA-methyltransferase
LSEHGTLWATIDDNEGHYLKVIADELFGRGNFVANIVWQSKDTPGNNSTGIAQTHNHVLVMRKSSAFQFALMPRNEAQLANYTNPDDDPRGDWLAAPLTRAEHRDRDVYPLSNPVGKSVLPPKGSSWRRPPEKMRWLIADNRVWWGRRGDAEFPMEKKFLSEAKDGVVNKTWWPYEFAGSTRNASAEIKALFGGQKAFDTPKPEKIVQRALEIASNVDDIVLDSFLGSGTTAAVAHKMGRRWIGIEMGEHARTHCLPRLKKVVEGEQGGISKDVGWQGGGGFRFFRLGEPAFDANGRIHPSIRFPALAAYVWFLEAGAPHPTGRFDSPLLGLHADEAIHLLYNGILGDRSASGGNVLTHAVLDRLVALAPGHRGPRIVYGEASRISPARLKDAGVVFRQIPYDIRMR